MKFFNVPNIIPASTVMNTTINSSPMQLMDSFIYSIQIVFTGTPTGAFKLQASDDPAAESVGTGNVAKLPTHWTDVSNSSFTVAAAGNVMWTVDMPGYNWVRVVYTDASSGASTAIITNAVYNAKG